MSPKLRLISVQFWYLDISYLSIQVINKLLLVLLFFFIIVNKDSEV